MAEIKTPEQIADEAARAVLRDNGLKNPAREDPLVTLGFEMGDGVEYEEALKQFALAAIEADRAQRAFLVTIREDCYDPRSLVVRPLPGESIANAVGREGDAVAEWLLIDAVEVTA